MENSKNVSVPFLSTFWRSERQNAVIWCLVVACILPRGILGAVMNGSFEDGINGWQFSGGLSVLGPPAFQPLGVDGTHCVGIGGSDIPNSWIEQTITLDTNVEYRLTLYEAAGGDGFAGRVSTIRVDVMAPGQLLVSKSFTNVSPGPLIGGNGFLRRVVRFVSPNTNVTLRITDVSPNGGVAVDPLIDNVVVARPDLVASIRVTDVEVCWESEPTRSYQLQYRSALTFGVWTDLGQPIQATGESLCVKDTLAPGETQRFYRILALPP